MSQSKFEVNVPLDKLPPAVVKVVNYDGSDKSIDVYQTYRSMAFSIKVINTHASNTITVSLDGENPYTVSAGNLVNLEGIEFTTVDLSGTGTGQVILKTVKQSRLKTNNLVEVD